jgi:membrane fusion protein (multidrug efflux system)
MFAYFNVSEPEYLDYETDKNRSKPGRLTTKWCSLKYKGTVEVIESEFNSETGNIAFRSRFPNPENYLKRRNR